MSPRRGEAPGATVIDLLWDTMTRVSERHSEKLQDNLDRDFLAGHIRHDRYNTLCNRLEFLTDYAS